MITQVPSPPPTFIYPCDGFNDGDTITWDGALWECRPNNDLQPLYAWEIVTDFSAPV